MDRDVRELLSEAERQGFVVRYPGKGQRNQHAKVYAPAEQGGGWITNFPSTPGKDKRRSILNSLAPLKRAGFVWPPQTARPKKKEP